jgi:hypothetical protein
MLCAEQTVQEKLDAAERAISEAEALLILNLNEETKWRYMSACDTHKRLNDLKSRQQQARSWLVHASTTLDSQSGRVNRFGLG